MTAKRKDDSGLSSDELFEMENPSEEEIKKHLTMMQDILESTQSNIKKALGLLKEKNVDTQALLTSLRETQDASSGFITSDAKTDRIIEGVFTGEKMVSGEGIEYNVPANYASKSKLVEGDILKLTIGRDGSFIYKQIGPVDRKQIVAVLAKNEVTSDYYAVIGDERWKLLTASVTYFHGVPGDEVVIIIPKGGASRWAAVENVIKLSPSV